MKNHFSPFFTPFLTLLLLSNLLFANQTKELLAEINTLKDNIWIARYENYKTYKRIALELENIKSEILGATGDYALELKTRAESLQEQLELLKEYERSPFAELLTFKEIKPLEKITNPFVLFSAFSYVRTLKNEKDELKNRQAQLNEAIMFFERALQIKEIESQTDLRVKIEIEELRREIKEFGVVKDASRTSYGLQEKKINEALALASAQIKDQIKLTAMILTSILVVILVGFIIKLLVKRFVKDNIRTYTIAKFTNVVIFSIIMFILIFGYIENISYVITILGFASAGLAIAMKDMFMSVLGWCVIFFGGTYNVGDRVRVRWQNSDYVGDIIDIGILRITIYEDITLTSYRFNRRSGRIIFIPNNYIFTQLIANYTHGGMKTVWDGIDIMLTFDSNHKKAAMLIKDIARKYSKGYTDIARRQMNKLRDRYSIKNPNVEPRIFTFFEPYGMCISVWFMTNSYAALALRSTISIEIIEALNLEDDIKIAYPTQTLNFAKRLETSLDFHDVSRELLY